MSYFAKQVVITNPLGLHARPAVKIAQIAKSAVSPVWIIRDHMIADATSVMDILTLTCPMGGEITVKVDSDRDIRVLEKIVALVEQGFGE